MFKHTILAAALAASFAAPAVAASAQELAEIRAQISAMKASYEARLQALEQRLQQAQSQQAFSPASTPQPAAAVAAERATPAAAPAAGNVFNPDVALILGGSMARLSRDPETFRLQGFLPSGGETGPGKRNFNLGESELTLSANVDPHFSGQLTFALSGDDTVSVEEAFVQTRALSDGLNLRAGRFLSGLGYLNAQHAHAWDFVDAPLAYQAFLGGQYKADGVQARWLAPSDRFVELGLELSSGRAFPGNERDKNGAGATALYAHLGDDIGDSASYRAGLSYLRTGAEQRGVDASTTFSGSSALWLADAVYKWAPNGNASVTNFKLQGEYFRGKERGSLDRADAASSAYRSGQSGWYLQGVYQFMPNWRTGLRYDRLYSGSREFDGAVTLASLPILEAHAPSRTSVMLDYSPSEFSRLRLQVARDQSRPGAADNQLFLQYIMSLGSHAAHAF